MPNRVAPANGVGGNNAGTHKDPDTNADEGQEAPFTVADLDDLILNHIGQKPN
jgi:hypothetical protein